MKNIYNKYKTIILYAFYGGLTTVVNIGAFFLLRHVSTFETTVPANAWAWFLSVLFAFFTNKYFVFKEVCTNKNSGFVQFVSFFAARLLSGVLDIAIVYVFVDLLSFSQIPVKLLSNILVVIINYVASKLIIFK